MTPKEKIGMVIYLSNVVLAIFMVNNGDYEVATVFVLLAILWQVSLPNFKE